jgi:hypothetical protein
MAPVVDSAQRSHLDFQLEGFDKVHRQHDWIDGDNKKRVRVAVLSADRDVFARQKRVCAEFVAGLIVVILVGIVVENPACVLGAAKLVDDTADLVLLAGPKPPNPAVFPILLPENRIDVPSESSGAIKSYPWRGEP